MSERFEQIGVVIIGRNEGERLRACLESVVDHVPHVVYVDSGSTDDSIEMARSLGAAVVELDTGVPFTAARARNAGIEHLCEVNEELEFVQLVDGDCQLVDGWLDTAVAAMAQYPDAAVACGRRRERHPDASVYNRLCDMEWNTPIGEARACGGDALMRLRPLRQAGGFNDALIAGEEPELCYRLRQRGWTVRRIDCEMTLHDAAMVRLGQWWKRNARAGYAYAEGRSLHGQGPERYRVREIRSIIEWAVILPLLALALAWFTWGASLLLFGGYVYLWDRVRRQRLRHGDSRLDAELYARYCVLGKFAQLAGACQFWRNRMLGRRGTLIEYKGAEATAGGEQEAEVA